MAIWSAVACREEHDTLADQLSIDQSSSTVTLRVAWSLRYALVADILGRSHAYLAGLRAASASIKPDGASAITDISGQILEYQDALVDVSYNSKTTEDLVTEELLPAVDFMTLDWRQFRWGAADGPMLHENEAPGRQRATLALSRTERLLSSIHTDHLTLVGHTNDTLYHSDVLGLDFDIDTLLFQPSRIGSVTDTTGAVKYTLTKSFVWQPDGWNKYWRAKTQQAEEIFIAGGARYYNFPQADFSNILA